MTQRFHQNVIERFSIHIKLILKPKESRIILKLNNSRNSNPIRRLLATTNTKQDHPRKQFCKPINTNEIKYNFSTA